MPWPVRAARAERGTRRSPGSDCWVWAAPPTLVVLAAAATPCTIHGMIDIIADSDHPVFDHLSPTWREELQWLHDRAEHLGLTARELRTSSTTSRPTSTESATNWPSR